MRKITFTRDELYELVWSESLPSLAKKYDNTYSELRSICNKMNIPLPKAEYWPIKRLGRPVTKQPLPIQTNGETEVKLSLLEEGDEHKQYKKLLSKFKSDSSNINQPKVSSRLTNPDPLIIEAQKSINSSNYRYGSRDGIISTESGKLDIRVAEKNIPRALRFMDALVKYFISKNYEIIFKNQLSYVKIYGEEIRFCVKEVLKRVPVKNGTWERTEMVLTDLLSFRIGESYNEIQFRDGKSTIEDQLPKIVARLEAKAEKDRNEREEREKYWAEHREKEKIKLEIQQKKEKDDADFKQLIRDAECWHNSKIIGSYIDTIEIKAIASNSNSDELNNWLSWARRRLEEYNPLNKVGLTFETSTDGDVI